MNGDDTMKELLHADVIQDDILFLEDICRSKKEPNTINLRMLINFKTLLILAKRVVSSDYYDQQAAIEDLESFLS